MKGKGSYKFRLTWYADAAVPNMKPSGKSALLRHSELVKN